MEIKFHNGDKPIYFWDIGPDINLFKFLPKSQLGNSKSSAVSR